MLTMFCDYNKQMPLMGRRKGPSSITGRAAIKQRSPEKREQRTSGAVSDFRLHKYKKVLIECTTEEKTANRAKRQETKRQERANRDRKNRKKTFRSQTHCCEASQQLLLIWSQTEAPRETKAARHCSALDWRPDSRGFHCAQKNLPSEKSRQTIRSFPKSNPMSKLDTEWLYCQAVQEIYAEQRF